MNTYKNKKSGLTVPKILTILAIFTIVVGGLLLARYHINVNEIEATIMKVIESENARKFVEVQYYDTDNELHSSTVSREYIDDDVSEVLNNIFGEKWVSVHTSFAKFLIFCGFVLFIIKIIMQYGWKSVKFPLLKGFISLLILGGGAVYINESEEHIVTVLLGLFCVFLGFYGLGYSIYDIMLCRLKVKNPAEYNKIIRRELQKKQEEEDKEQQIIEKERIFVSSQDNLSPFGKKYIEYSCPYCGHYKVSDGTLWEVQTALCFR